MYALASHPSPSLIPTPTQLCGSTCSMLVRGIAPVVKAWPSMTAGVSDRTISTFNAFSRRRSSATGSVKLPSGARATHAQRYPRRRYRAQILAHLRAARLEEADQPAVMVEVPVA